MVGEPKPPLWANSSVFSFKELLVESKLIKEMKEVERMFYNVQCKSGHHSKKLKCLNVYDIADLRDHHIMLKFGHFSKKFIFYVFCPAL